MPRDINQNTKQFRNGMRIEGKEHPGFSKHSVAQIVTDHIVIHPNAYKHAKK